MTGPQNLAEQPFPSPTVITLSAAILAYAVLLDSWWVADDWNFLAAVTGLVNSEILGARLVSQKLYWYSLYPLFGLNPWPWAAVRLALHASSALLVVRIARQCGLDRPAQAFAGIFFATTSLAFTPLLWNCGTEELLGVFFALFATLRWLAGHRLSAFLLAVAAILSKEAAFGLPVLLAALSLCRPAERRRSDWLVIGVLAAVVLGEALLVYRHFRLLQDSQDYALGSPLGALANLGLLSWFSLVPLKFQVIYDYRVDFRQLVGGAAILIWVAVAVWRWRLHDRLPAACLLAALVSVAATLPLATHIHAYYAYAAMAPAGLTLAALVFQRRWQRPRIILVLALVMIVQAGVSAHLRRNDNGYYLSKSIKISRQATAELRKLDTTPGDRVIIIRYGNRYHRKIRSALAGETGPRVLLGDGIEVQWLDNLTLDQLTPRTHLLVEQEFFLRRVNTSRLTERGFTLE